MPLDMSRQMQQQLLIHVLMRMNSDDLEDPMCQGPCLVKDDRLRFREDLEIA